MTIPYKPLELSQSEVEVLKELIFSQRLFPLSQEGAAQHIRFVLPLNLSEEGTTFSLALKTGQQQVGLMLTPTAESDVLKCLAEFGGVEAIPKDFLTAVRGYCSRKVIHFLEAFLQVPLSFEEEKNKNNEANKATTIYFEVISNASTVEMQGRLTLPLSLLNNLLTQARQLPRKEHADLATTLLEGELLIGTATLTRPQWDNLMAGDLVFFEEPSACSTGVGFFYLREGQKIPLSLDPKELQPLIQPLSQKSSVSPEGESSATPSEHQGEQTLGLLEVELMFSVSTFSLTLEEIILLSKTKKLAHLPTFNRSLKILVQGKPVGAGELVELHGQPAIFITQLRNIS